MLNNDAASTTYSHVALGFDPYYAIPVPKPGLQHEPGDISHDGILLTLYEHIVSDEAGDPAGCNNAIEIKAEIPNQHEKFIVVAEQARIVERRIVVGRTGDSELNGFVRNLLHHPTVPKHDAVDRAHSISSASSGGQLPETQSRTRLSGDICCLIDVYEHRKAFSTRCNCLNARDRLWLLFPITFTQERGSFNHVQHHSSNHHSRRYRLCKRENRQHPSSESVGGKKMLCVLGVILLFLSFSLATLDVNSTSRKPITKAGGQASVTGGPSFSYASQWGSYGGPIMPNGVAVDFSGNVYIADAKSYVIVKLSSSGSFVTSWGSYGTGPGQFSNPEGVALDGSGNVYVSDSVNNNIQKFTNAGRFIASWNTCNKTRILKHPFGLAVNATGFLYAVDQGDQRVQIYRNNGTYVASFGGLGSNLAGKFQSPFGVAVGPTFVYVSDSSFQSGNITELTRSGGFVCTWGGSSLFQPAMVATDNASNVYVTDNFGNDVVKFSACNNKAQWISGSTGASTGQFDGPVGVAVDGQMNVYVGDSNNFRIQRLSASSGSYLSSMLYPRPSMFASPYDAAVDGSGHIYVVDEGNNRVQMFSLTGTYLMAWGTTGTGNGQFYGPFGIAIDSSNNVYVTDYSNNRVQKFDSSGNSIIQWGSSGAANGQFSGPTGVAVDGLNNVYVVDSSNNRIEKFTSSGGFLTAWGSSGSGNGQFSIPGHLSPDSTGDVYVSDTYNDRVQEFTSSGTFLTSFGTVGSGNGQFVDPEGLTIDASGSVYVIDTGNSSGISNNRVEVFTSTAPSSQGSMGGGRPPLHM